MKPAAGSPPRTQDAPPLPLDDRQRRRTAAIAGARSAFLPALPFATLLPGLLLLAIMLGGRGAELRAPAQGLPPASFNLGFGHNGATLGNLSLMVYDPATQVSVMVYLPLWDLREGATSFLKTFNALQCTGWRARETLGYAGRPPGADCAAE